MNCAHQRILDQGCFLLTQFAFLLILLLLNGCSNNHASSPPFEPIPLTIFSGRLSCENDESQILTLKSYLVDKYNPQSCFGMPAVLPPFYPTSEGFIESNPRLADFVRNRFDVTGSYSIAEKMKQLCSIKITQQGSGYMFRFTDGRCCDITTYEGTLQLDGQNIIEEITNVEYENVPC